MSHQEAYDLIADYLLDLLPAGERAAVESHLEHCDDCQARVRQERALLQAVRGALAAATRPAPGRLAALMPAPPRRTALRANVWRPVAAFCLLLVFAFTLLPAAWSLPSAGSDNQTAVPSSTSLAATATLTPTTTVVEEGPIAAVPAEQPPDSPASLPALAISPPPAGTPVVSLLYSGN